MWEAFLEAFQAIAIWLFTGFIAALTAWMVWVTKMLITSRTRIHILEENVKVIPTRAQEIKDTLRDMRAENLDARDEAYVSRELIHEKLQEIRLEWKQDLKDTKMDIKEVAATQIQAGLIAAAAQLKAGFDSNRQK